MNSLFIQINTKNKIILILSIFSILNSTLSQIFSSPSEDILTISLQQLFSYQQKQTSITYDYKIKNCKNDDRKLLLSTLTLDMYIHNRPNKYKVIQKIYQNSAQYSIENGENGITLILAEICMKEIYVQTEYIDTSKFQTLNFSYKSKPKGYNKNMKAIPFLIGYDVTQGYQKNSVFIESWKAQDDEFEFFFSTTIANSVKSIDINYLYFDENNLDSSIKIDSYQETKSKSLTPPLIENDKRGQQFEKIPGANYCKFGDPIKCGIFLGVNGFDLLAEDVIVGLRARMQYQYNQSTKQLEIAYQTWHVSKINGMTSQYAFFQIIKCNSDTNSKAQINYKGSCIEKCPDGEFEGQDSEKNIIICKKCSIQCKTCINLSECLSCPPQQYLYKRQCYDKQPQNSYCKKVS